MATVSTCVYRMWFLTKLTLYCDIIIRLFVHVLKFQESWLFRILITMNYINLIIMNCEMYDYDHFRCMDIMQHTGYCLNHIYYSGHTNLASWSFKWIVLYLILWFDVPSQKRNYITWYYLLQRCSNWYVTGKFIWIRGDQGCM